MTTGYGISSIGYPYGLGTLGLGTSGTYGSYDSAMPSMLGMNMGSGYGMNALGLGMGMYSPQFMGQMAQIQNQIEASQLQHAGAMNTLKHDMDVKAQRRSNSALIEKVLTDADVQIGVKNLNAKILEQDQNGVCEEFDKLLQYVYNTYRDEIEARGDKSNAKASATQIIEVVYSNIIHGGNGSLKVDIQEHCDTPFENGFTQAFKGGHSTKYADEAINHIYGTRINQVKSKNTEQFIGKGVGEIARTGKYGLIGAGVGATVYGALSAGLPVLRNWTAFKWAAGLSALGTIVAERLWSSSEA